MLFNLNEYKNYLINFFVYPYDDNESLREKRKEIIESKYTDDFLQDVINNTEEFIMKLLECLIEKNTTYIKMPLEIDNELISTNLVGGWHADTLVSIDSFNPGKVISYHLLKKYLGLGFHIDFDESVTEFIDDEDPDLIIGGFYGVPELSIQSKKELIQEKYEDLKNRKQKELVRVLKKKLQRDRMGIYN